MFVAFCVIGVGFFYHVMQVGSPVWMQYFIVANTVFYLIGGAGLLTRSIVGFVALKIFLYVLVLSFPIGTLIAVRVLRYMKRVNVRVLFMP
jgi:hypothetical protein